MLATPVPLLPRPPSAPTLFAELSPTVRKDRDGGAFVKAPPANKESVPEKRRVDTQPKKTWKRERETERELGAERLTDREARKKLIYQPNEVQLCLLVKSAVSSAISSSDDVSITWNTTTYSNKLNKPGQ